ncbi:hypothetical protein [Staphylococcus coagulans]
MEIQLDWDKDFQEFQEILNSGIHPLILSISDISLHIGTISP